MSFIYWPGKTSEENSRLRGLHDEGEAKNTSTSQYCLFIAKGLMGFFSSPKVRGVCTPIKHENPERKIVTKIPRKKKPLNMLGVTISFALPLTKSVSAFKAVGRWLF